MTKSCPVVTALLLFADMAAYKAQTWKYQKPWWE